MPTNAIVSRITPDEYHAFVAVNGRQASISDTRAIRSTIGAVDDPTSIMRNDIICEGWINNRQPPELTDFGLSLTA